MNLNDRFACDEDNIDIRVQYECSTCGAVVYGGSLRLHNEWHEHLEGVDLDQAHKDALDSISDTYGNGD